MALVVRPRGARLVILTVILNISLLSHEARGLFYLPLTSRTEIDFLIASGKQFISSSAASEWTVDFFAVINQR